MNVLILAGGKGTRFREETELKPKPMIEINGTPMVIHIIDHYMFHGLKNFTILAGTKIEYIIEYFDKSFERNGVNNFKYKDSNILILDTGKETMTGGRIKFAIEHLNLKEFMLTYGDGISDVDIGDQINFYKKNDYSVIVTAGKPPPRFGRLKMEGNNVIEYGEKKKDDENWINIGYFIMNKKILPLLQDETTVLEKEPLEQLSKEKKLGAYFHDGFWQPVDTIREKEILEENLASKKLKWQ